MSERTTIGGTVYETVGSSNSNLLLKCNGTARIQWGNKLIDLIRNGKIVSDSSSEKIFVINDESEIRCDGIYILNTNESLHLWICKNGKKYNLTETDLYISATNKQDITGEQQQQALENLGLYYYSLEEAKNSGIMNGVVYIINEKTFYTIKEGLFEEFEAKIKNVTVELNNTELGEHISSNVRIVLSINDSDYLVLSDQRITANYSIHVKDSAQLGSEGADDIHGYRLYMYGGKSYLDVDNINVRSGLPYANYVETTYETLIRDLTNESLQPNRWYLIKDFQNHWKLTQASDEFRPILVQAITKSELYPKGLLFEDQRVEIEYDPLYSDTIVQTNGDQKQVDVTAKGKITWMKDWNNNEASFDFLDYYDALGNPLTTLHDTDRENVKSVFPCGSANNSINMPRLKGTVINNKRIDNVNTYIIDIKSSNTVMTDNNIKCFGFVLEDSCKNFCNNIIENSYKLVFNATCVNNRLLNVYNTIDGSIPTSFENILEDTFKEVHFNNTLENTVISKLANSDVNSSIKNSVFTSIIDTTINKPINNCTFDVLSNCTLNAQLDSNTFKSITDCVFSGELLVNVTSYVNLQDSTFAQSTYPLLYNQSKIKEVYNTENGVHVVCPYEHLFYRGMIMMHSGLEAIPEGWAMCDGKMYEYNGIITTTPDLSDKFIKATTSTDKVGFVNNPDLDNNKLTIGYEHLPKHDHPHNHTLDNVTATVDNNTLKNIQITSNDSPMYLNKERSLVTDITDKSISYTSIKYQEYLQDSTSTIAYDVSGTTHNHTISNITGTISNNISTESGNTWQNMPINIEPNYYALIFIIKL